MRATFAGEPTDRRLRDSDLPAAAVLLLVAVALAAWLYADFLADARLLWRGLDHDRNGHFHFGVSLAVDLRSGDIAALVTDLNRATGWPPVHGILLALVLLVGGIDERLGVLPSLAGWVITLVAGALAARRLMPRAADGAIAPAIAAAIALVFIAASPGLREYALEVMLESLGAALTTLGLYLYLRAKASSSGGWWRGFALVLTLLFLEKGNYWGLLVGGIVLAELAADPRAIRAAAGAIAARLRMRAFWVAQARAPLSWVLVALIAAVVALLLRGPTAIMLFGRPVSLYPPQNLITAAWWVVCLRAFQLWRQAPSGSIALSPAQRILVAWHVLPVAVWFLLPRRLGSFVWFVGPGNAEPVMHFDPVVGFARYVEWAAQLYHATPATAGVAAVLAAVAALNVRRLAPGGGAVLAVFAVSLVGAALHPNQKARFLVSWLPTLWILAGAGGAIALATPPAALGWGRRAITAAALLGLAWWHAPALTRGWQPPAWAGGVAAGDRDIAALYLDRLPADRRVAIASAIGGQSFFTWTFLARFPDPRRLDLFRLVAAQDRARVRADLARWVMTTNAEVLVVVEATDGRFDIPEIGLIGADLSRIFDETLAAQPRFQRGEQRALADGSVRATLWTRAP
jgi:hypothetical protein